MEMCPACSKGRLSIKHIQDKRTFEEVTYAAKVPTMACDQCDEDGVWFKTSLALSIAAARQYILDGYRGAEGHRQCRKCIGMNQGATAIQYGLTMYDVDQVEKGQVKLKERHWRILLQLIERAYQSLPWTKKQECHIPWRKPCLKATKNS